MENIQLDNTYLVAKSTLPILLSIIKERLDENPNEKMENWITILEDWEKTWNYEYNGSLIAPTFFEEWINNIRERTWSDDLENIIWPEINILENLIVNNPNSKWFDIKNTPNEKEVLKDICNTSFDNTIKKISGKLKTELEWQNYRGTDILHIIGIPQFSSLGLKTSGAENIINATRKNEGPSWRYIIEMSQPYKILGIYPGGQSGYPGSFYYDNFIPDWVSGKYKNLIFPNDNNEFEGTELKCIPKH